VASTGPDPRMQVEIQAQRPGNTSVVLGELDGTRCVMVDLGAANEPAALTADDGLQLAIAAFTARTQRLPLICHLNSSGAPPDEGT
jgi:hypothetical protein